MATKRLSDLSRALLERLQNDTLTFAKDHWEFKNGDQVEIADFTPIFGFCTRPTSKNSFGVTINERGIAALARPVETPERLAREAERRAKLEERVKHATEQLARLSSQVAKRLARETTGAERRASRVAKLEERVKHATEQLARLS